MFRVAGAFVKSKDFGRAHSCEVIKWHFNAECDNQDGGEGLSCGKRVEECLYWVVIHNFWFHYFWIIHNKKVKMARSKSVGFKSSVAKAYN